MMMKSKLKFYISICLLLASTYLWAGDWIIASQAFSSNKKTQVFKVLGESLPSLILDSLGDNLNRDVLPDEKIERTKNELEKARLALFLQLSAEYKKRDNLVLGDYSKHQLKKKQKEADAKIKEIEDKIQANIKQQQEAEIEAKKNQQLIESGKYSDKPVTNEVQKWLYLFKNMFVKNQSLISQEAIAFYKNDSSKLFVPSTAAVAEGFESYQFQKEVLSEKINTLLTGNITSYGDFISVNVEAYLYPGTKRISSVMEVGTIKEVEYIANSIANKLVPEITNALPVELYFHVLPENAENLKLYLDNEVINLDKNKIVIQSGIKKFQAKADGYKSVSTTYNFLGNRRYSVELTLEPENIDYLYLNVPNSENLSVFANGKSADKVNNGYSKIIINGQTVLGQIVSEEGMSGLYYIAEKNLTEGSVVKVNPKLRDNADYIEKRRKWMYGSYSALMVSLIPYFVTTGEYNNYYEIFINDRSEENYVKAKSWAMAADVSMFTSIGCGVFFGYELVRYLISANSVLPKKASITKFVYVEDTNDNLPDKTEITKSIDTED